MTKEELEKKAAAYAKKHRMLSYCGPADTYISDEKEIIKAVLHFAEPMLKDLEKAKELIEDIYIYDRIPASYSDYYKDVMERAKQFLKED